MKSLYLITALFLLVAGLVRDKDSKCAQNTALYFFVGFLQTLKHLNQTSQRYMTFKKPESTII
ncbi:hypothetical protein FNH22_12175 [Fulvivirga sp. M361]|nr:hypothetical protein FNH22_12175 [Fulvivirga sp. M361]